MRNLTGVGVLRSMLMLGLGVLAASPALAGGLRCSFGEVVINNLKIGKSYSLVTLANLPLTLTNTDDKPSTVRVDAQVPGDSELRQGAEAIPSVSWASAEPDSFVLAPNQSRSVELKLTIPDDEKHFGKKYEVVYWSHTMAQEGSLIAYGLKSRVIFGIDVARDTVNTEPPTGELSIKLSPSQLVLHDAVAGHEYSLESDDHQPMKVKNTADHPVEIELQALSPKDATVDAQPGFEDLLSAAQVTLTPSRITLAPGEEKAVMAKVAVAKGAAIKGRKFMCVVSAAVVNLPVRTQIYSRIYVHAK